MTSPDIKDDVMVESNTEVGTPCSPHAPHQGVDRVIQEKGGFAFMMEDAGIQYIVERNCELAQIGGNLDTKGYGIATRPDSGFKDLLDSVSPHSPDWPRLCFRCRRTATSTASR